MLVISRRRYESIIIGDNITITVVGIKGNAVRLGIDAPTECRIVRQELMDDRNSSNDSSGPDQHQRRNAEQSRNH
jgi:carbon storage regulator